MGTSRAVAEQDCRIALRRMQDHLGACGGVDEKCDVGDGDERSPHDPDERDAPSRCRKPSRPPRPHRGMPSRQRRGEASLGLHGPVGAWQSSPAHRASPRTLLRRRTRPAQSPARLHPGAFLARIATACIAARGRARPPTAAGSRARAEPALPPRATHRPSALPLCTPPSPSPPTQSFVTTTPPPRQPKPNSIQFPVCDTPSHLFLRHAAPHPPATCLPWCLHHKNNGIEPDPFLQPRC